MNTECDLNDDAENAILRAQERAAALRTRFEAEDASAASSILTRDALVEIESALEQLRVYSERISEQNDELQFAYQRLAAEHERYTRLFYEAPDGYILTDSHGVIHQANDMAAQMLGVRPRYLIGKPLINYVAMPDRPGLRKKLLSFENSVFTSEASGRNGMPVRITPPGGREAFDATVQVFPNLSSSDTTVREVRWILRDISENAQGERAYYQLLVDAIEEYAILVLDADFCIRIWNRGAERLFGYSTSEALGMDATDLFVPEDREKNLPQREQLMALDVGSAPEENWHQRKDGTRFFASGVLISLPGAHPDRRFVKILRDATLQKYAEETLHQTNDALEERVRERTAELAAANASLQAEMVERKRAEDERRDLLRRWVRALEDERRRISRELHDEMGQHLTAFALGLRALENVYQVHDGAPPLIGNLQKMAEQLGKEVHRLAVELRPTALDDLGLTIALKSYVEAWEERTGIHAQFHVSGKDTGRLPGELETTLYRSAQEALTNILKYAGASEVSVLLQIREGQVTLIVEDNGCGFDPKEAATRRRKRDYGGLGLAGIEERAALVGGEFTIESTRGSGTTLFVRAPLLSPNALVKGKAKRASNKAEKE